MSYCETQRPASAAAVGAKTARACDGCLRRRARWFCEADDAYLCQACDVSVHSANPLARRHRRVRLKTASSSHSASLSSLTNDKSSDDRATPSWLHGFKRKPRTPRGKPGSIGTTAPPAKVESLVPDLEVLSAEDNHRMEDEEEQLIYCVPILDPVLAEFYSHPGPLDDANASGDEVKPPLEQLAAPECPHVPVADGLSGYHPTDLDLAEFASDMETLLGRGLDDDSFGMVELGLMGAAAEDDVKGQVKTEMDLELGTSSGDDACDYRMEIDLSKEGLELGFSNSRAMEEVEEHKFKPLQEPEDQIPSPKTRMILTLDYDAVVVAWSSNGCSPWMDGERPQLDLNDSWKDFTEMGGGRGGGAEGMYQQVAHMAAAAAVGEGREARVSRYREKRRTRLFSKKIRYEVRKLNAEKRPRMKGRFVKRTLPAFPVAGTAAAAYLYR
ncbi:hypothetical protein Cni_G17994 [Canna indica]|uniref:Zinc finger protein CONSTANS-LIKE 16 n=1 Tax=Canna indica TaxID=4628 RepID=A0AAQ3QH43_9LILI|nr:hypothetical protein Cni_G17994 [Canna indica]